MRKLLPAAAVASAFAVAPPAAEAQDAEQWRPTLVLCGQGAAIAGTCRFGNLSLPVGASLADFVDALTCGARRAPAASITTRGRAKAASLT